MEKDTVIESDYPFNGIATDSRLFYEVVDMVAKVRSLSSYRLCHDYKWDYQNYCSEKRRVLDGRRKLFSLMELYWILLILNISFTSFFYHCENC